MKKNPCADCASGDCAACITNPENSVHVKLYTPKGAARAMLVGKKLQGEKGRVYWFGEIPEEKVITFWCREKNGEVHNLVDFRGLWEEF